ncbi:MAG: peptidyl-prolyl cis-trans isomerase [Planctomycetes bacterium]|jgi:parvulin-like peptidyl-prolyl isomerase|nr:peptidyl-prolyl cis-trans isomerase [Planctomycetota bacterium]
MLRPQRLLPLLFLLLVSTARAAPEKPRLPDGVAAIVRGTVITMNEFEAALVRRFAGTDQGKKALDELVEKVLLESEAASRGVAVSDADLEDYERKVAKEVSLRSGGSRTLADLLAEKGITLAEFRKVSRDFLIRQRLAAPDLGVTGEVTTAQISVWLSDLKRRRGVRVGAPDLPPGVLALVGGRAVRESELGEALRSSLETSDLESALWDLAIARAVKQDLEAAKIVVEPADIDTAIAELREDFASDPRFRQTTFTFEQYVEAVRHLTVSELRTDPLFLAQVGLAKRIRQGLTPEQIAEFFTEHRERYGEQRTFIHLVVKADDRAAPFGKSSTRSYEEAKVIIDALYARYLRGTPFEKLILESSEDRSNYSRPDRLIRVNRETHLPESLRDKVFEAPPGEVVGPVRTPYGYHLLKVTEVTPPKSFEEARPEIVRDLVRDLRTRALLEVRQDPDIVLRYQ